MQKPISYKKEQEMPSVAMTSGTTEYNKTGSWRYLRPAYAEKTAPCSDICLAKNEVREFVRLVSKGRLDEAWHSIMRTNPFPAVSGRICPHPCTQHCNRKVLDFPIRINEIEAMIGDHGIKNTLFVSTQDRNGKTAAVLGSGPAGLSCAFHLMRKGYAVTVYETAKIAGGSMRAELRKRKIDQKILDKEIAALQKAGILILTGVDRSMMLLTLSQFDACFIEKESGFDAKKKTDLLSTGRAAVVVGDFDKDKGRFISYASLPKAVLPTQWIAFGKKAADVIDAKIRGTALAEEEKKKVVEPEGINLAYFSMRQKQKKGTGSKALIEDAMSCFSCGKCTMCDNCLGFCPDCAISRKTDGSGYVIDYDFCKGCGVCAEECPRSVIDLVEEGR